MAFAAAKIDVACWHCSAKVVRVLQFACCRRMLVARPLRSTTLPEHGVLCRDATIRTLLMLQPAGDIAFAPRHITQKGQSRVGTHACQYSHFGLFKGEGQ